MKKQPNMQRHKKIKQELNTLVPRATAIQMAIKGREEGAEIAWQRFNEVYLPTVKEFCQKQVEMIAYINQIDIAVSLCQFLPEDQHSTALATQLAGKAGELSKLLTEFALIADRINSPLQSELISDVKDRIVGIKKALNDGDNGKYLFELATQRESVYEHVKDMMFHLELGRPTGMGAAQTLLLSMAEDIRSEVGVSWAKAGYRLKYKLEQIPEDEMTATQYEALQLITYRQANGQIIERDSKSISQYLRSLSRRV